MKTLLRTGQISFFTILLLFSLVAAWDLSSFKENQCQWTTFGIGYSHTQDPFGIALAISHTRRLGLQHLNLRAIYYNDIQIFESSPDCYAFDIGLLYGPYLHFTFLWSMSLSLSAGISYIFGAVRGDYLGSSDFFESEYEEVHIRTAAFPVQLELRLIPNDKFSISLNGSANINSTESFYSTWIGFSYGIQRSRSDITD